MSTYTSRSRFDEARRFTGVFQQMDRVVLDSDWNEEVRIRTTDAARRTADVADGSPDDGFRIAGTYVLDATTSVAGWSGIGLPPGDARHIPTELVLDRKDPSTLPFVVRAHGFISVLRTLPAPINLVAIAPRPGGTPGYSVAALVITVRFEVPPNEDELTDVRLVVIGPRGQVAIALAVDPLPRTWREVRIPIGALAQLRDPATGTVIVTGWGLTGVPARTKVWIDALRAEPAGMGREDFTILGGDGSLAGAGRMFVGGARAFLPVDLHYLGQSDYPDPVALADLAPVIPPPADGHYFVYLDTWELPITAHDDDFIAEPALDGADTTTRRKLVQQVKAAWVAAGASDATPAPVGPGALTTSFSSSDARPLRYATARVDPTRGLFTESIATQTGYRGTENVHVRVEVLALADGRRVLLWSRRNGSQVAKLVKDASLDATTLIVAPEDAAWLHAGDTVVIEDLATRLQPAGPRRRSVVRRVLAVDIDTGSITIGAALTPERVGGPAEAIEASAGLPSAFTVANKAGLRRWDAADWLVADERYNLSDGIDFAFTGDPTSARSGDAWSFTARVLDPDGLARGAVEALVAVPPMEPTHRYAPLGRITEVAGVRRFEDVRRRFLPLANVRDRLKELEAPETDKRPFTVVVGDGITTFGDVDQATVQGVTGDEAIQTALKRIEKSGGTVFVRAGDYVLERPVVIEGQSRVRIVGDGDATQLRAIGAGGAIVIYASGLDEEIVIEDLSIHEQPTTQAIIGRAPPLAEPEPVAKPITMADLRQPGTSTEAIDPLATGLRALAPGQGRTFGSILATLARLRWLQKTNPGADLAAIPEAAALLDVLRRLPHGVITIADSTSVRVRGCRLRSDEPLPLSAGVFVSGTCERVHITENRIETAAGVVASPLMATFSDDFLAGHPASSLSATDLVVDDNDVRATGEGVYGVWLGDGLLDGVVVSNNRISKFAIGIEVGDRSELRGDDPASRVLVQSNRVTDSRMTGILVAGDAVDVAGNEVRNAASDDLFVSSGLFNAAIQVAGRGVRVRDSWIELPAVATTPALGVFAGIVVGQGLDDGESTSRAVHDVDITDNRIEGAGASTLANGIFVGGPDAVVDVRVRGNVIRNLGDAAVRLSGSGAGTVQIVVDGNRVEEVALAEPSLTDASLRAQVALLSPTLNLAATAFASPQALLAALVASPADRARGALDGALRWIERASLRGGLVASQADAPRFTNNSVVGVGRYDEILPARPFDVRCAAIAIVGGSDARVADNHLEEVRAAIGKLEAGTSPAAAETVAAIDALAALSGAGTASTADNVGLHLAAAGLHRLLFDATNAFATFADKFAGKIFGSLDALTSGLVSIGETSFAQSWSAQVARLRTKADVATLDALRAHVAHLARVTAGSTAATTAWQAVEDLEGAIAGGSSTAIASAAQAIAAETAVLDGLPALRATSVKNALTSASAANVSVVTARAASDLLADVALLRDEADQSTGLEASDVFGHRRQVISSLASAITRNLQAVAQAQDRAAAFAAVRSDVNGLVQLLQEAGSDLSRYLLVDFRAIDQPSPVLEGPAFTTVTTTLGRVLAWADGGSSLPTSSDDAANAAVSLSRARALASLRLLDIDDIDQRVAQLDALGEVARGLQSAAIGAVTDSATQLAALVDDAAELVPLAHQVTSALQAASAATDPTVSLRAARDALAKMRDVTDDLGVAASGAAPSTADDLPERRLSGLAALALALRDEGPGTGDLQTRAMELFATHADRAASETNAGTTGRRTAADTVAAARAVVVSSSASATAFAAQIFALASLVESMASNVADGDDSPERLATATLARAASLSLDPSGNDDARVKNVLAYLASRKALVSAAIVDRFASLSTIADVRQALRQALERLAVGEATGPKVLFKPLVPNLPEPADGVFAAGVSDQLRIASNTIETALTGVVVASQAAHLLASSTATAAVIEVLQNQLRGCAIAGVDIVPADGSTVTFAENQITGSAELVAHADVLARAGVPGPFALFGQASARFSGTGALVLQGNLFQGNGSGQPNAILHEVLVDWRGDLVVRANTIRHSGGGAGGAGLALLVETLDSDPARAATLLQQLATSPALAIDKPPPLNDDPPTKIRAPWRGLMFKPIAPAPVLAPHYLARLQRPATTAPLGSLVRKLPPPLPLHPPSARRSVQIQGNHVQAFGPALLLLGAGTDVISASVSSNAFQSSSTTGAVYVRHTDATVFTGNQCECLGAVNVVVMRFDAAPVSVTGNVIIGDEPVAQRDPNVLDRRNDLKKFIGFEIAKQAGVLPDVVAAAAPPPPAPSKTVGNLFGSLGQNLVKLRGETNAVSSSGRLPQILGGLEAKSVVVRSSGALLRDSAIRFALAGAAAGDGTNATPAPTPAPAPAPTPTPAPVVPATSATIQLSPAVLAAVQGATATKKPDPRARSLVILGGTRVVSAGNTTTAGVHVAGADNHTELDV